MADDREIVIRVSAKNLTKKEFDSVRASVRGVTSDIERQGGILKGMTGSLKSVAGLMGVTFGAGAVVSFTKSVFDAAENISDMAARMGVGTDAAQEFAYAARQSGGDLEGVSRSIVKMNQVLAQGDKGTVQLLKSMGLELNALRQMKPEDAFRTIAGAIEKVPNPIQQTDIALKLLGKSGAELLPALRNGFLDVAKAAPKMSEETIKRLDAAKDAWGNFFNFLTIQSGEVLGNLVKDVSNMAGLFSGEGPAAAGFKKFFGDVRATAAGFFSGGLGGATAAHADYMKALGAQRAEEKKAVDEKKKLADENKKLADSTKWLETKTGELTEAQKDAQPAAEAQRKAIQGLVDELSGSKLRAEVTQVNQAIAKLNAEQKKNPEVLDRILDKIKPLVAAGGLPLLSDEAHKLYLQHEDLNDILPQVGGGFDTLLPKTRNFTLEIKEQTRTLQAELAVLQNIRDFGSLFINKQPFDLSSIAVGKNIQISAPPSLAKSFGDSLVKGFAGFASQLGPVILSALTGGGDVGRSVGAVAGGFVAQKFTDNFAGFLERNLGKTLGGAIGSVIPGLGTLLGSFGGELFGKLFGAIGSIGKNVTAKSRESFARDILGFSNLGALYDDLKRLGAEGEKLAHIGLNVVGRKDEAANRAWMEAVKKFYDDIKTKQGDQAQSELDARDRLQAAVEKYGFTIDELGPKWRAQKLTEQARGLLEEYTLLTGSGIEQETVIRRMAGAYNEYFQIAMRTNTEIPIEMKPTLERMVELGELVDENGNKIENLEGTGVTFSTTMSQGFKGIIDKLDELIRKVTGDLGKALTTVPKVKIDVDDSAVDEAINRRRGFKLFAGGAGELEMQGAQHGGLFSRPAVRVVAEAGPEVVGSPNAIVDALAAAMSRLGLGGGGGLTIQNLTISALDGTDVRRVWQREIIPMLRNGGAIQTETQHALGMG